MSEVIKDKGTKLSINNKDKFIWKDGDVEVIKDPELVRKISEDWLETHIEPGVNDDSSHSEGKETQES